MIIYAVTNLVNGKRYIGMTEVSLARRWSEHKKVAKAGSNTALHAAIRKYGPANFAAHALAQVLPGFDREVLGEMERLLIQQEGTLTPGGYNMTPGGDGLPKGETNPNFGRKASEERKAKIKAGWTPERKVAHAETMRNLDRSFTKTEEHRAKLRAVWTPEQVALAQALWTPERRAAQQTDEYKALRKASFTEQSREKLKASWTPERRLQQAERLRVIATANRSPA